MVNPVEILLVEDSPYDAELTLKALKKRLPSNDIFHVKDGAEALDFLFAKGIYHNREKIELPKVILLDLKLPKVDGKEVLKELKENNKTKAIPIVILTSSKEMPDIKECYLLGANSYIVKPVDFEKFLEAISELGFYWLLVNQPFK